jgi:hypothetical protein
MVDIDKIILEWSWRCEKGYPDLNTAKDLATLKQVLKEMNLPSIDINGPATAEMMEAKKVTIPTNSIFNADYLNGLYPKHAAAIMKAYRDTYTSSKDALELFGTIETIDSLITTIKDNKDTQLFKELYNISSVSGKEGEEAATSGRGGLGKGEVLCVLLTKDGKSGGTSGTDLDGSITAEIKAGKAKNFKVPLGASRITRFESQAELRKLYSLVETVKDTDEYNEFLADIQNELGENKMKMQDGVYFGKKPTPSNINSTEYKNIQLFFNGCHKYFYETNKKSDDTIYVDLDTEGATGDMLLLAKLISPSTIENIKEKGKIEIEVQSIDKDNIRTFKLFSYRLKQHPYVAEPLAFRATADSDLNALLQNKYIIFHETTEGVLNTPIVIDSVTSTHKPEVIGYTLDAVMVKFEP